MGAVSIMFEFLNKKLLGVKSIQAILYFLIVLFGLVSLNTTASASEILPRIPQDDEVVINSFLNPPEPLLLPDMRTLPPTDLHLTFREGGKKKRLRFQNTIWNSGSGPLEMQGVLIEDTENVKVSQHVYRQDGTFATFDAGTFYFEDDHDHWHWTYFSLYQIWSLAENLKLDQVVANNEKVGYCLIDHYPYSMYIENPDAVLAPAPDREYHACTWIRQGISANWTDSYRSHIPGQHIDITHLPDGIYALKSTVDPLGVIEEVDINNNTAVVYFELRDGELLYPIDVSSFFH